MGRTVAGIIIFLELMALLLIGQFVAPYLGRANPSYAALIILGLYFLVLAKMGVAIWALVDVDANSWVSKLFHVGSLLPIGLFNAGLAYRLGRVMLEDDPASWVAIGVGGLTVLFVIVAVVCLLAGLLKLVPRAWRPVRG